MQNFAEYFNLDPAKSKEIAELVGKIKSGYRMTAEDLKSVQLPSEVPVL